MVSSRTNEELHGLLGDLSVFVSFLFFIGFIYIVAFYGYFGLRFSDVEIKYHHILFRGVSLFSTTPALGFLGMLLLLSLVSREIGYSLLVFNMRFRLDTAKRFLTVLIFPLSFFPASEAGFLAAQSDSHIETTTLREIVEAKTSNGETPGWFISKNGNGSTDRRLLVVYRSSNRVLAVNPAVGLPIGSFRPSLITLNLASGDFYVDKQVNNIDSWWRSYF